MHRQLKWKFIATNRSSLQWLHMSIMASQIFGNSRVCSLYRCYNSCHWNSGAMFLRHSTSLEMHFVMWQEIGHAFPTQISPWNIVQVCCYFLVFSHYSKFTYRSIAMPSYSIWNFIMLHRLKLIVIARNHINYSDVRYWSEGFCSLGLCHL